jgi:hypothetical protein
MSGVNTITGRVVAGTKYQVPCRGHSVASAEYSTAKGGGQ